MGWCRGVFEAGVKRQTEGATATQARAQRAGFKACGCQIHCAVAPLRVCFCQVILSGWDFVIPTKVWRISNGFGFGLCSWHQCYVSAWWWQLHSVVTTLGRGLPGCCQGYENFVVSPDFGSAAWKLGGNVHIYVFSCHPHHHHWWICQSWFAFTCSLLSGLAWLEAFTFGKSSTSAKHVPIWLGRPAEQTENTKCAEDSPDIFLWGW